MQGQFLELPFEEKRLTNRCPSLHHLGAGCTVNNPPIPYGDYWIFSGLCLRFTPGIYAWLTNIQPEDICWPVCGSPSIFGENTPRTAIDTLSPGDLSIPNFFYAIPHASRKWYIVRLIYTWIIRLCHARCPQELQLQEPFLKDDYESLQLLLQLMPHGKTLDEFRAKPRPPQPKGLVKEEPILVED